MNSWNGFGGLDLTNVQEMGPPMLQPGTHIVTVQDAKVEDVNGTSNKKLVVTFVAEDGSGQLIETFNIHNRSPQATEIGMKQLKSFLVQARHPNPGHPGDVATMLGLRVGILVDMGKPWWDRAGRERQTPEVKRYFDVDKPISFTPRAQPAGQMDHQAPKSRSALHDDIPF